MTAGKTEQTGTLRPAAEDIPALTDVYFNKSRAAVGKFHKTMAETLLIFVSIFTAFACALAFGVVYNSGRIALSERGRELATLRVLGFTHPIRNP